MRPDNLVDLLRQHKVVIPPIQRDYAQGRESRSVTRVRDRFLVSLADVLENDYDGDSLNLDFVYGYVHEDETGDGSKFTVFKPLDGQQRLTTLFLLHWYAAVRDENGDPDTKGLLARFSYATRSKSRQFCEELVKFQPEHNGCSMREQIENQPWFFMSWFKDPTIASMLVMLDAIESVCTQRSLIELWKKLAGDEPRIRFHMLEMTDIGLPDDLYIKMNSRGKQLTDFEFFKSFFARCLRDEQRQEFIRKIDNEWSNLFWNIFKSGSDNDLARKVDAGFLRFFKYVTDLIIAKNGLQPSSSDEWERVVEVYSDAGNVDFLFSCLDLFTNLDASDPECFSRYFYLDEGGYKQGTSRLFFARPKVNLFHKCAEDYDAIGRVNPFSLGEQLLLYAFICHKHNKTDRFAIAARKLRNLIASSEDRIRREHLASLCEDVECIVQDQPLKSDTRFSTTQIEEEAQKKELCVSSAELEEVICKLEDHNLLRGTISAFDISTGIKPFADVFHQCFRSETDYIEISRAMLALGDYSQLYGGWRRLGNQHLQTWRELFTPNEYRKGFERTRKVLKQYLQRFINNQETTNQDIISTAIGGRRDWRYYYVKYDNFRQWNGTGTEGFYYWENFEKKPLEYYMMYKRQFNGRHWIPFLLTISELEKNCSLENYGNDLHFACGPVILGISMENDGFTFHVLEDNAESTAALDRIKNAGLVDADGRFLVPMKSNDEDEVDRIQACVTLLRSIGDLYPASGTALDDSPTIS